MKPVVLVPLVALALAGGGVGAYFWLSSGGGVEEAVVAQPTATPTPTPPPSAIQPSPTPTTAPGGMAPDGCLASELVYADPGGRFAFCYPADMELATVRGEEGIGATVQYPVNDTDRVVVTFGWEQSPSYKPCIESPTIIKNARIENLLIAGKTVSACFQDHYDPSRPDVFLHTTIDFAVPAATGTPVLVLVAHTGPNSVRNGVPVAIIAMRILHSAVVY
jgi:hypothetical protein